MPTDAALHLAASPSRRHLEEESIENIGERCRLIRCLKFDIVFHTILEYYGIGQTHYPAKQSLGYMP
jgi:hypothetical protein